MFQCSLISTTTHNAIGKFDYVTKTERIHRLPDGHSAQEQVSAARPGATAEDDGGLLTVAQDADNTQARLRVLDAREPLFVVRLRHHLPLSFHRNFTARLARS